MKAVAAIPSRKEMRVLEQPAPGALAAGQARVDILEVGVCGTDREIARFDYGEPPPGDDHLVIGHESLGRVAEVAPGVSNVKVGDLVVTTVRRPCTHPECTACRHGRQDFCFTGDFTERGIRGRHGYMTEQIVDDAKFMHRVPDELRHVGVLTEPLTIAQKAIAQLRALHERLPWTAGRTFRDFKPRALVLGAGPVGLLGAMSFLVEGFDTVVYSRSRKPNDKSNVSETFGVPYISAEKHPVDELPKLVGQIDVVYEATGASRVSFEVLKVLGANGVFVFTGVPGRKGPSPVDTDFLMRNMVLKNQLVLGTVNAGPDAFDSAIAALGEFNRRWPVALGALITNSYALDDAPRALSEGSGGIKDVVRVRA